MLVAWDIVGKNGFFKPQIAYEPNYDWNVTLGYVLVWGDSYQSGIFGPVKETDEVYFKVAYKF